MNSIINVQLFHSWNIRNPCSLEGTYMCDSVTVRL